MLDADPARTRAAVDAALADLPLPDTATVVDGEIVVDRGFGLSPFRIRVETAPTLDGVPYTPVSSARVTSPDHAVIRVSESASPRHIRRALAANIAELDTIARERAAESRTDATSMLAEGSRETRLSTRDAGRIAELRVVADELARAAADPARLAQARADAAGLLVSLGLVEPAPSRPVHTLGDNAPLTGPAAAQARAEAIRAYLGDAAADVQGVLDLAATPEGQAGIAAVRAAQAGYRARLRAWAQDAVAARDRADAELTARVDAALAADSGHVFDRLILGGGWAATADFVTLGAAGDARHGLPPVLAVSIGGDPWGGRGDLLMGQVPGELEIDGLPFQPADFADDPTSFARSRDFAAAIGAARAMSGMPTYHGAATSIEPRPETGADDWPAGARYRVTVNGRLLYTNAVDVVSGPGPARIPSAGDIAGRRFTDPVTGFRVDHGVSPPTFTDRAGNPVPPGTLPEEVRRRLGFDPRTGALGPPQLADPHGRLTDDRLVDPVSGLSVDPSTRQIYDAAGRPVDRSLLDLATGHRLGFGPDGSFRDRRYVTVSGYAVHTVTGHVFSMTTGTFVDPAGLDADTRAALEEEVRRHRVQFGGENLAGDYRPGDRVLVFGAGASGAWDIEQATQSAASTIDWTARQKEGLGGVSPDEAVERSFRDGYNRRNTVPGLGAYSAEAQARVSRSLRSPVEVRATVDGQFAVRFDDGSTGVYDRVVFSIGQEATDPGGAQALLRQVTVEPLTGPGGEINGLRDAEGGVRVLGAASVAVRLDPKRIAPARLREMQDQLRRQTEALPDDSRRIAPSIRHHGQRIAEANRPAGPATPATPPTGSLTPPTGSLTPPAGSAAPPAGSTAPPAGSTAPPAGSTAPPAATAPPPAATAPPAGPTPPAATGLARGTATVPPTSSATAPPSPAETAAGTLAELTQGAPTPGQVTAVRQFFDALDPAVAADLARAHPDLVGNLDGAPYPLRATANRLRIEAALDALRSADGEADPRRIATLESLLEPVTGAALGPDGVLRTVESPRQLVAFDPTGAGRAAEVLGDLPTAENVVVLVPGVRADLDTLDRLIHSAGELAAEAGGRTAVLAWLGPDTGQAAEPAAAALRSARAALALEHGPDVRTTVVAHGFGAVVASLAVRGTPVDTVVVLGSPGLGTDVRSAADLGLAGGTRFVAVPAPADPAAYPAWRGTDPVTFADAAPLAPDGGARNRGQAGRHQPGDPALRHLGALIAGVQPAPRPEPATGDRIGWTGPDGRQLTGGQVRAAAAVLAAAAAAEATTTSAVSTMAAEVGAAMVGLEHRVKSAEAVYRELAVAIAENPGADVEALLADVKDTLRYTLQLPFDEYTAAAQRAVDTLVGWGFESVTFSNTWAGEQPRGITGHWRDPRTGQVFELRIHTGESLAATRESHLLFERQRLVLQVQVREEYVHLPPLPEPPVPECASTVGVRGA